VNIREYYLATSAGVLHALFAIFVRLFAMDGWTLTIGISLKRTAFLHELTADLPVTEAANALGISLSNVSCVRINRDEVELAE
jgi:hypothetical protein